MTELSSARHQGSLRGTGDGIGSTVSKIFASLSSIRRLQIGLLPLLMLLAAGTEVFTIGALIPFITAMLNPDEVLGSQYFREIVNYFGTIGVEDLRVSLTKIFITSAISVGVIRFLLSYATAHLNFKVAHELGHMLFRSAIDQPYIKHIAGNSSDVLSSLTKVDEAVHSIHALLVMTNAAVILIITILALMFLSPLVVLSIFLCTLVTYTTVYFFISFRISSNSKIINQSFNIRTKAVQEGLGGLRDVILGNKRLFYIDCFRTADLELREAQANNAAAVYIPRYAIETVGMCAIAFVAYTLIVTEGVSNAFAILAAVVLGSQRMLPLAQQIYQGWVQVKGNSELMSGVAGMLDESNLQWKMGEEDFSEPVRFSESLACDNLSFRYPNGGDLVISSCSFEIRKGDIVSVCGRSGAGKSTLVDLLSGLLVPTDGSVLVDGIPLRSCAYVSWQSQIAYVSQAVYLTDASFSENIAFGTVKSEIDQGKIERAARFACLHEFILSCPEGYATRVGERGVRLSGGQRQRIGIARAMYRDAKCIIFDEATNALDAATENQIIESLVSLSPQVTIIIISHRETTLQRCNRIIEIKPKGLVTTRVRIGV